MPVGGIVVGVVSGFGAASLGVTEKRIAQRRIMFCNSQSQAEDKKLMPSSAMSACAAPPRWPGGGKLEEKKAITMMVSPIR